VILGIQKQPGANTLALTRQLDATLDDLQRTLPAGMVIDKGSVANFIAGILVG
jgi:multidrug efflux pump subunit AcrB